MKLLRYDRPGQERSGVLGRRRTDPRSVHTCAGYYARLSRPRQPSQTLRSTCSWRLAVAGNCEERKHALWTAMVTEFATTRAGKE